MSRYLSKQNIIAAPDLQREDVHVPEWRADTGAEYVCVQGLTAHDRSVYNAAIMRVGSDGKREFRIQDAEVRLAAMGIVDPETAARLFTDDEVADLGRKDARPIERIAQVVLRLSALTPDAAKQAAANFPSTQNGDSTSR